MKQLKYHFEIDVSDVECNSGRWGGRWANYGTLVAEGNTLDELLDNASVDVMDQDGGELACGPAEHTWMHELLTEHYFEALGYAPRALLETHADFRARVDRATPAVRVCLQFDECKPHWAEYYGYRALAMECGLKNIRLTGDFDAKLTYIYGDVDNLEAFRIAVNKTPLREGSLYEVSYED